MSSLCYGPHLDQLPQMTYHHKPLSRPVGLTIWPFYCRQTHQGPLSGKFNLPLGSSMILLSLMVWIWINFGPNKIVYVLILRGPGVQSTWKILMKSDQDPMPIIRFSCKSLPIECHLVVIPNYIYLDQLQDLTGHPATEVHKRFTLAKPLGVMLTKNIFKSPKFPFATKILLFKSIILSKLQFGTGAWQSMNLHTTRSWQS